MKFLFKHQISGFNALSRKQRKEISSLATKGTSKAQYIFLSLSIAFIYGVTSGLIQKELRESIGHDDFWWVGWVAALPVSIVLWVFYEALVVNPKIEQIIKGRPNQ